MWCNKNEGVNVTCEKDTTINECLFIIEKVHYYGIQTHEYQ
jgi:hypothetical protein